MPVFEQDGQLFGLAICADLTNPTAFARSRDQGAHLVFEVAAPGLYGPQETRDWQAGYDWWETECAHYLSGYARDYNVWVLVATQAGRTVDEDFPGGAFAFAPNGQRVFSTENGAEGAVFLEIDFSAGHLEPLP